MKLLMRKPSVGRDALSGERIVDYLAVDEMDALGLPNCCSPEVGKLGLARLNRPMNRCTQPMSSSVVLRQMSGCRLTSVRCTPGA